MGKTIFGLLTVAFLGLNSMTATLAQNSKDLNPLRHCVPKMQGRHLVDSMNVIGQIPYQGGMLFQGVLGFEGQSEQVLGEIAILLKDGKCALIYEASYWGNSQQLTEVFDRNTARQLAYQWLAHRVEIIGRDVIQNSLNTSESVIPDHYLWAYKKLGFTVPNQ